MSNIESALLNAESALAVLRAALEEADMVEIQNQDLKDFMEANRKLYMRL